MKLFYNSIAEGPAHARARLTKGNRPVIVVEKVEVENSTVRYLRVLLPYTVAEAAAHRPGNSCLAHELVVRKDHITFEKASPYVN